MLAWENSGFSIDASVRITLLDRDVPSYFQSLEHLLRYCARPGRKRKSTRPGANGVVELTPPRVPQLARRSRSAAAEGCSNTHEKPRPHDTSRIAWATLMARVGEEFPFACPACGGDIRLISFITDPGPIRKILTHLGEPPEPPPISPARGPLMRRAMVAEVPLTAGPRQSPPSAHLRPGQRRGPLGGSTRRPL